MLILASIVGSVNWTLGVVSKRMNQAEAWRLKPDRSNPHYHVHKYSGKKRDRFLTAEELARLGNALDEEEPLSASAVTKSTSASPATLPRESTEDPAREHLDVYRALDQGVPWLFLDCIAELPQNRLHELLPGHWKAERQQALAA